MSRDTKRRLDPYEMVEERLEESEKRISKIEEKVSEIEDKTIKSYERYIEYVRLVSNVACSDTIILDWVSTLARYTSGDSSQFDTAIEAIREKRIASKRINELGLTVYSITVESQIKEIIRIARSWTMPFDNIGSYLIGSLGKEEARKLVGKEDLMACYGKDIIPIWESLLKE